MPASPRRRLASAQALLPLEEIASDVVCLRGGDYRGVLEAGSVNFALKSEAEQEAILAGYRRFLNALAYPVQVLVRVVPTDVEVYLDGLRRRGEVRGQRGAHSDRSADLWRRLAQDHETFVRRIARERTLLDRRCYVVVPAGTGGAFERSGFAWPRAPWRRPQQVPAAGTAIAARRAIAFRCAEVAQGLAAFGVPTRRLGDAELVALWRSSLAGTPVSSGRAPSPPTAVVTTHPTDHTKEALDAQTTNV